MRYFRFTNNSGTYLIEATDELTSYRWPKNSYFWPIEGAETDRIKNDWEELSMEQYEHERFLEEL